jgi:NTP pyrophosphatase (non-canonical NTP hydrolase)
VALSLGRHDVLQQEFDPAGARASVGSEAWRRYVEYNALAAVKELTEFLDEVEIRPWKQHIGILDREAAIEELIDVLFFVANLALAVGADDREFDAIYESKMAENFDRLLSGRSVPIHEEGAR